MKSFKQFSTEPTQFGIGLKGGMGNEEMKNEKWGNGGNEEMETGTVWLEIFED